MRQQLGTKKINTDSVSDRTGIKSVDITSKHSFGALVISMFPQNNLIIIITVITDKWFFHAADDTRISKNGNDET